MYKGGTINKVTVKVIPWGMYETTLYLYYEGGVIILPTGQPQRVSMGWIEKNVIHPQQEAKL